MNSVVGTDPRDHHRLQDQGRSVRERGAPAPAPGNGCRLPTGRRGSQRVTEAEAHSLRPSECFWLACFASFLDISADPASSWLLPAGQAGRPLTWDPPGSAPSLVEPRGGLLGVRLQAVQAPVAEERSRLTTHAARLPAGGAAALTAVATSQFVGKTPNVHGPPGHRPVPLCASRTQSGAGLGRPWVL